MSESILGDAVRRLAEQESEANECEFTTLNTWQHEVSPCCGGERCSMCGEPATHKVGEEGLFLRTETIDPNAPFSSRLQTHRHNYTAYVCCTHFGAIFGPAAVEFCSKGQV